MLKNLFFILIGLIAGIAFVYVIEMLGHEVLPLPTEIDPDNVQSLEVYIRTAPVAALLFVVFAWFFGTFAGTLIAVRMSGIDWTGWTVGFVLFVLSVMTLLMIPHPFWMWIAAVFVCALGTFLGITTGQKIREQAGESTLRGNQMSGSI